MKRPSFQFYHGDWRSNAKLRRLSHGLRGIWLEVMCLMADDDEFGLLRWPLEDIAAAVPCKLAELRELIAKGVLKGADAGERSEAFTYTPRHAGRSGKTVTLIEAQAGPLWYSSRMVRDEYIRNQRASHGEPKAEPKAGIGEALGSASGDHPSRVARARSSSSSPSGTTTTNPSSGEAPDIGLAGETAKAKARREARAAAERAIAYLNSKAGTRFQPSEANLRFAMGRLLYDRASERDLQAVVDLKIAEAAKGEFDRKYLRPATLFGAEKFSQYVGQVGVPGVSAPIAQAHPIMVRLVTKESNLGEAVNSFTSTLAREKINALDLVVRTARNPELRRQLLAHRGDIVVERLVDDKTEVLARFAVREVEAEIRRAA